MPQKKTLANSPFNWKAFAFDILAAREAEGKTFSAVQKITGVNVATIHRAEAQYGPVTIDAVISLCNWLCKPIQYYCSPSKPTGNVPNKSKRNDHKK